MLPPPKQQELSNFENVVKIFNLYRDYVKHEDELINRRMSWNLTLQGFLFAAYGVTVQVLSKATEHMIIAVLVLLYVIPALGAVVAFLGWRGVKAAQTAIEGLCKRWEWVAQRFDGELVALLPEMVGGGEPKATGLGQYSQRGIPMVVLGTRVIIMAVSAYLTFTSR